MELAKRKTFEDALSEVLALMIGSGLKGIPEDRKGMAQAWVINLKGEVEAEWLLPAAKHFTQGTSPFFPTVGEFLSRAKEIRRYELHTKSVLEATKEREKAIAEANLKALQEKYPDMDQQIFRELFQRTAQSLLGGDAKALPEYDDPEKLERIARQKEILRG